MADESQHAIVDMLDKALSGEDPLSEISESDGELLDSELSNISFSSMSNSQSSGGNRRRSNCRRKSSFGGDMRSEMLTSLKHIKHHMKPEQLAILLRKYYEQDKELRRLEADLQDVDLDVDFEQLGLEEATDRLMALMEEVEVLQDEVPDQSARNHQADLDHVLLLLKNEYNRVESLTSLPISAVAPPAGDGQESRPSVIPLTEDQVALVAAARRIRARIQEIEQLKEELRDKLEEVRILEQLPVQ